MHVYVRIRILADLDYPQVEHVERTVTSKSHSPIVKSIEPNYDRVEFPSLTWNNVVRAIHDGRSEITPKEYILRVVSCLNRYEPNSSWRVVCLKETEVWEMTYKEPQEQVVGALKREPMAPVPEVVPTRFEREEVI